MKGNEGEGREGEICLQMVMHCLLASFKVAGDGNMLCCIVYFLSLEWGTAKSYWSKINRWRRTEMFSWIHCELFVANTQLSSNSCSRSSTEHFYLHVSSFEHFTIFHRCTGSSLVRLSAYYLFSNFNLLYLLKNYEDSLSSVFSFVGKLGLAKCMSMVIVWTQILTFQFFFSEEEDGEGEEEEDEEDA